MLEDLTSLTLLANVIVRVLICKAVAIGMILDIVSQMRAYSL